MLLLAHNYVYCAVSRVPEGEVEVTTALQDWCLEHLGERKRKEGVVGLVATALTS